MIKEKTFKKRACDGKVKHKNRKYASLAAIKYENVKPYHCPFCGFYHSGHITKTIYAVKFETGRTRYFYSWEIKKLTKKKNWQVIAIY